MYSLQQTTRLLHVAIALCAIDCTCIIHKLVSDAIAHTQFRYSWRVATAVGCGTETATTANLEVAINPLFQRPVLPR